MHSWHSSVRDGWTHREMCSHGNGGCFGRVKLMDGSLLPSWRHQEGGWDEERWGEEEGGGEQDLIS